MCGKDCPVINPVTISKHPSLLHQLIENAWEAIEHGDISSFEQVIHELKELSPVNLNTCRVTRGNGAIYCMSLLAFCGFHKQQDMVDLLLKEGADVNANHTCPIHGAPLCQMMLHCLIQHLYDELDVDMLRYFIKNGAVLRGQISAGHGDIGGTGVSYGLLDLPLSINRVDCAKVLVEAGVDRIDGGCPGGEKFDVVPMFQEYCSHGTNKFIRWMFNEYLLQHPEIDHSEFAHQLIKSIINMNAKNESEGWWSSQRRSPAHAVLTSGNQEMIKLLVEIGKDEGLDLLTEKSATGSTALHIAAQNDDDESAHILLQLEADTKVYDHSDKNPFMLAVEKGQLKVAKLMIEKDPSLASLQLGSGVTVVHWALERGLVDTFFKCFNRKDRLQLLGAQDSDGSSIAHLAASSGNAEVFKIFWSKELTVEVFRANNENKDPLHLAVEHGHVHILNALKECVDGGREGTTPDWHMEFRKDWYMKMIPYFLYACSCGSLNVVKDFVAKGYQPNINHLGKTPLLCAATSGHEEIVAYLLQFTQVLSDLKDPATLTVNASKSPLLAASQKGYTKCVTHLLQKGGSVLQTDHRGRNCLIIAIQSDHEDVVEAIIGSDAWVEALRPRRNMKHKTNLVPFKMMIQKMPDIATKVLDRCTLQDPQKLDTVVFDYQFMEDFGMFDGESDYQGEGNYRDKYGRYSKEAQLEAVMKRDKRTSQRIPRTFDTSSYYSTHPLTLMVNSDCVGLLEHPLVGSLLHYKWRKFGMPLYIINLLLYLLFVIFLTIFALLVLTPQDKICKTAVLTSKLEYCSTFANSECEQCGLSSNTFSAVYISALLTILMASCRLFIEFIQMFQYKQYFTDPINYLELLLYGSTLTFASVLGTPCLCPTNWQWQFGILAVFLGWINLLLFFQKFPEIGIYIVLFLKICRTFLRTIALSLMLLTAFGLAFYMAFDEPEYKRTAFSTPVRALLRTTAMATGEYDFNENFRVSAGGESENQTELAFLPITAVIWLVFIPVMPILLINMLTGLAVGDVKDILNAAQLKQLAQQIEMVLSVEQQVYLSKRLRRWFDDWFDTKQEIKIRKSISWWQSVSHSLWGVQLYMLSENIDKFLESLKEKEEMKAKEKANALQRSMGADINSLQQQMNSLERLVRAMAKHQGIPVGEDPDQTQQ